jgi:hypothetical protein
MHGKIKHMEALLEGEDICPISSGAGFPADNQLLVEIGSELYQPLIHLLNVRARVLLLFANTTKCCPAP